MTLLFLAKTLSKYSVVNLTECEGALSCMKGIFLRNANLFFSCHGVRWGAPSESGCRLWQSSWLHLRLWMAQPAHYQWLQPKTSHRHPFANAWSGEAVDLSCPSRVARHSSVNRACLKQCLCQKWQNHAMAGLFSWFKSHRQSLEHPQEESLLLWQRVHGQEGPLGCHSDCFQRHFIGWFKKSNIEPKAFFSYF